MLLRVRCATSRLPREHYQCDTIASKATSPRRLTPAVLHVWRASRRRFSVQVTKQADELSKSAPRPKRGSKYAPYIDVESLQRTLEAVREANRAKLIRKPDQHGKLRPIDVPSILKVQNEHSTAETPRQADPEPLPPHSKSELGSLVKKILPKFVRVRRPISHEGGQTAPISNERSKEKPQPTLKKLEWRDEQHPASRRNTNGQSVRKGRHRPLLVIWDWTAAPWLAVNKQCPWLDYVAIKKTPNPISAMDMLAAEIRAFGRYMTPTEEEKEACDYAIEDMARVLKRYNDTLKHEIMGSRASGLAMTFSDVDINIMAEVGSRHDDVEARPLAQKLLKALNYHFQRLKHRQTDGQALDKFRPLACLLNPRVPVLVVVHKRTGLHFQIQQTVTGFNTTQYARAFKAEYPTLQTLFYVIKQMLKMRGLTDGQAGGITSYPLLNMIVASLKLGEGRVRSDDIAGQLLSFLDLYSELNIDSTGLSVIPLECIEIGPSGEIAPSHPENSPNPVGISTNEASLEAQIRSRSTLDRPSRDLLYLRDPADPTNNLGRTAFYFRDVQESLIAIRQALQASIREWDDIRNRRQEGDQPFSILQTCVKGDYTLYDLERESLCAFAARRKAAPPDPLTDV